MWVSVSAQASALSETWAQNLDLTIPSSEMPLTWELDLKDKQEIMMGWTCCYRNELINSVQQEHSDKLIQLKLKEKPKRLRFIHHHEEPSEKQLRYFYIMNFLDMTGSYYFIKNNPNIREGNFLLPDIPGNSVKVDFFRLDWTLKERPDREKDLKEHYSSFENISFDNLSIGDIQINYKNEITFCSLNMYIGRLLYYSKLL